MTSPVSIEEKLNYHFRKPELLARALTHRSYHNENSGNSVGHNERLEFLGDAVLDFIISEKLFQLYPDRDEGSLSKLRASLVNETSLAEISKQISLGKSMKLGRGEEVTQGYEKPRLLAGTFEAIVGAIYIDSDYASVKDCVLKLMSAKLSDVDEECTVDFKTRLQETTQKILRRTPSYELLNEDGPDHEKTFTVRVSVGDKQLGQGCGRSKKLAEQSAAANALENLKTPGELK